MLTLTNLFENIFNHLSSFYKDLADESKYIIYVVAALLVILTVLIFVLIEQIKYYNRKKASMKPLSLDSLPKKEETLEKLERTEVLDFNVNDIDMDNEKTRNLQEITQKLQEVIDNHDNEIDKFEQEQEENSIISYEELVASMGKQKSNYDDEEFVMPELARKIEKDDIVEDTKPIPVKQVREERFKASDFISPVYGIQHKVVVEQEEQKEEPKIEIKEEIVNEEIIMEDDLVVDEEQFLSSLRNLRNNLN